MEQFNTAGNNVFSEIFQNRNNNNCDQNHLQVTCFKIQGTNFEILVQTPGRFASAHPIPQDIIPAKK